MNTTTKWYLGVCLVVLSGFIIITLAWRYSNKVATSKESVGKGTRNVPYMVDIRKISSSERKGVKGRTRRFSVAITSRLKSAKTCFVKLTDGKVFDVKDGSTLLSMLKSNDREEQMMALYALLHMPDLPQKKQTQLLDAVIRVFRGILKAHPWNEKRMLKKSITKTCFVLIMLSDDPRADKIRKEAKKSDKKILQGLVQDVETIEQKLGRRTKRDGVSRPLKSVSRGLDSDGKNNAVSIPGITGIKACTREELITSLRKVMGEGSNDEKYQALNQLLQWRKYFKSKEGKEKRRAVTSLLMKYYKHEDTSFGVKEDIVTRLGDIGKGREVRSFLENIADDDETKDFIRDDAKMALKMWDAQHRNEK